jgi:hypothetical protein
MNKQELESIIRKIVKEEVSIAVPKLIIELLQADKKNVVTEQVQRPVARSAAPVAKAAPKRVVITTKNPLLNQILAETEPGLPSMEADHGVNIGLDGKLTMESVSVPSNAEFEEPVATGEVPTGLFKHDFSAILKKANKIAKRNRPASL